MVETEPDPDARTGTESRADVPAAGGTAHSRGPDRLWRWSAAASVLIVLVLHTVVARGARTPSFPFDEVVLLQYSKFLSGAGPVTPPRGAGYFPAWSVVMAPIWWFTENPAVAYRVAIGLGVVVAVATIWPLARAVTRLGLTVPQATVVASLVMALPARTVQSGYVTSEKLLFLALACTVLAALRLWEKPTVPRALVFGLAAAVLATTHARAVVLLIACVIWLLLLAIRSWRAALAGIAVALPLGYLAFWSGGRLNQYLGGGFSQGEKVLSNLLESPPSIILRATVGQAWEQTAGSLGLVAVGLVVLLVLVWRELRHGRSIGPACLLAAMLLGVAVLSIGQWASESRLYLASWRRLDAWLYGRYLDPVTALLVALGAAAMIRGASRKVLAPALALIAGLVVVTVFWLAPDAPTWGYVTPAHIPGVMPWFWTLPEATSETWPWGLCRASRTRTASGCSRASRRCCCSSRSWPSAGTVPARPRSSSRPPSSPRRRGRSPPPAPPTTSRASREAAPPSPGRSTASRRSTTVRSPSSSTAPARPGRATTPSCRTSSPTGSIPPRWA